MAEDYKEPENNEWIIDLVDIEDAVELALEINPDSINTTTCEEMYQVNEGEEPWICVLGKCDICDYTMIFFAPATIYEEGIMGVECGDCGSMSVYPQERNQEEGNKEDRNCDEE